ATPFRIDRWNFSAAADTQIQFDLVNKSNPALLFDLAGPNGYAHANLQNGDFLTLPTAGNYVVSVSTQSQQPGAYGFRVRLATVTNLTLGTLFTGGFDGSGQAQLFRVNVPEAKQLLV